MSIREYYKRDGKELPSSKGSFYLYMILVFMFVFFRIYMLIKEVSERMVLGRIE